MAIRNSIVFGLVMLLMAGCGASAQPGSAISVPSGPLPAVVVEDCPDPDSAPRVGEKFQLPGNPSWARICAAQTSGGTSGIADYGPPDALITNLDGFVTLVNNLPVPSGDQACTADYGPSYTLVVGYLDGSSHRITGELFGCAFFGNRIGAKDVLKDFGVRLRMQRDSFPDLAPKAKSCSHPEAPFGGSFIQPNLNQTTSAVVVISEFPDERIVKQIIRWAVLRDEILANSKPVKSGSQHPSSVRADLEIDAMNDQCESLRLLLTGARLTWFPPNADPQAVELSKTALAELKPYLR